MFEEGFKKELRASQKQRREQQVREVENKPCKGNCQDAEACRLAIYVFPTTCILSGTYMQFPPASLGLNKSALNKLRAFDHTASCFVRSCTHANELQGVDDDSISDFDLLMFEEASEKDLCSNQQEDSEQDRDVMDEMPRKRDYKDARARSLAIATY
jgi:hypothetical protein